MKVNLLIHLQIDLMFKSLASWLQLPRGCLALTTGQLSGRRMEAVSPNPSRSSPESRNDKIVSHAYDSGPSDIKDEKFPGKVLKVLQKVNRAILFELVY